MITVKFPRLNKALTKDVKDLPDDDPRRGILVVNNTAMVITNHFVLAIDLLDYFTLECGIEDEDEIAEVKRILYWMEERCFSKEFWEELTKGANIGIINGNLHIDNPKYSKDLFAQDVEISFYEPLYKLSKLKNQAVNVLDTVALPFGAMKYIYDVMPTDFATDFIICEFTGQDMPVKFTFRKRKHVYGLLIPHYDAAQEGFKFDTLDQFVSDSSELLKYLTDELKTVPPPPPLLNKAETVEVDEAQIEMNLE